MLVRRRRRHSAMLAVLEPGWGRRPLGRRRRRRIDAARDRPLSVRNAGRRSWASTGHRSGLSGGFRWRARDGRRRWERRRRSGRGWHMRRVEAGVGWRRRMQVGGIDGRRWWRNGRPRRGWGWGWCAFGRVTGERIAQVGPRVSRALVARWVARAFTWRVHGRRGATGCCGPSLLAFPIGHRFPSAAGGRNQVGQWSPSQVGDLTQADDPPLERPAAHPTPQLTRPRSSIDPATRVGKRDHGRESAPESASLWSVSPGDPAETPLRSL